MSVGFGCQLEAFVSHVCQLCNLERLLYPVLDIHIMKQMRVFQLLLMAIYSMYRVYYLFRFSGSVDRHLSSDFCALILQVHQEQSTCASSTQFFSTVLDSACRPWVLEVCFRFGLQQVVDLNQVAKPLVVDGILKSHAPYQQHMLSSACRSLYFKL